jgi:hypothetical protein
MDQVFASEDGTGLATAPSSAARELLLAEKPTRDAETLVALERALMTIARLTQLQSEARETYSRRYRAAVQAGWCRTELITVGLVDPLQLRGSQSRRYGKPK